MEFGFCVNNLLLDNIDEDIPIAKSASTSVMNHQNFKAKINLVFEKYDEVTLNQLKKSIMKELLSQYPPKSTYLENENNLITALRNHIVSLENEILFLKKEMETKNQLISILISTQLLTQKQSLRKELNPDCQQLNEKKKKRLRRRT